MGQLFRIIGLFLLWTSLAVAQETSEEQLLSTPDQFYKEKKNVPSGKYHEIHLPRDKAKKSSSGANSEVIVKTRQTKKKKKPHKPEELEYFDTVQTVPDLNDPRARLRVKKKKGKVSTKGFQIKTYRLPRKAPKKAFIQLQSPPHKSTLTPGVVTFKWIQPKKKRKRMNLILERVNSKERYVHRSRKPSKQVYVGPGRYRWQVYNSRTGTESKWRYFKVITSRQAKRGLNFVKKKPGKKKKAIKKAKGKSSKKKI